VPLPLLTVAGLGGGIGASALQSFWSSVGVHGRLLVTVPLLIMADRLCTPRLFRIFNNFERELIVADCDAFVAERERALWLFDSRVALGALLVLAYVATAAITLSFPAEVLPAWHRAPGRTGRLPYTAAGWWHVLVGLPLTCLLLLRWLWRIGVWARLLARVARLELRLVASHPDGTAGLGFLGSTLRAWAPLATALSSLSAARTAQVVLRRDMLPKEQIYFDVGLSVVIVLMFAMPLVTFTPVLTTTRRRLAPAYAALALHVGRAFEARWIARPEARHEEGDPLRVQDFSATTDLYSVVDNARELRWVPMSRRDLITLVLAVVLPFLPVVLLTVPIGVILTNLRALVF